MNIHDLFDIQANPSNSATAHIPGKLFIAGEYAILKPKQAAILVAVNQYLTCSIIATHTSDCVVDSCDTDHGSLVITEANNQLVFQTEDVAYWSYVIQAMTLSYDVLSTLQIPFKPFKAKLTSQLTHSDGIKYGLGSSGAVTVAVILAFLHYHGIYLKDAVTLFKLAAIASLKQGSKGSMADIATLSIGGWVYYQNFDHDQIRTKLNQHTPLADLLLMTWDHLIIEPLTVDSSIYLKIGWTGNAASTQSLVENFNTLVSRDPKPYSQFQEQIEALVPQLRLALIQGDWERVQTYICLNCECLSNLSNYYQLPIVTPKLTRLVELANDLDLPAKLSGAGGGDCGIALSNQLHALQVLAQLWQSHQIIPLDFTIAPRIIL